MQPRPNQSSQPISGRRLTVNLEALNFAVGHGTHEGRSRTSNKDRYHVFDTQQHIPHVDPPVTIPALVAVVADGIGRTSGGEIASQIAVDSFTLDVENYPYISIQERLENAVRTANREIFINSIENPLHKGMGTTIVAAAILGKHYLYIVHAGDSRAYLIRDRKIHLLTIDHTWVQEALDGGYLTLEQAKKHPNRKVIKRYLGPNDSVDVDHSIVDPMKSTGSALTPLGREIAEKNFIEIIPGDTLLLCSDGLTDVVSEEEILTAILRHQPQKAVEELINAANNAGGPDNITVVILERIE